MNLNFQKNGFIKTNDVKVNTNFKNIRKTKEQIKEEMIKLQNGNFKEFLDKQKIIDNKYNEGKNNGSN